MSWKFLDTRCHELLKVETNSNTSIAKTLIKEFKLNANMDTIRMYISKQRKLLNRPGVNPSTFRIEFDKDWSAPIRNQPVTNKDLKSESESSTNHINPTIPQSELLNKSEPQLHLILGCIHVPFENKVLLNKIFQLIKDNKFTSINLIGDVVDCANLSSHSEGIQTAIPDSTIYDEYDAGYFELIKLIRAGNCKVNFIEGNHCQRVYKYNSDLQKAKTPVPTFEEYCTNKNPALNDNMNWLKGEINIGKFTLVHGIYYNEYPSKKHLTVFRKNMIFAHTHRIGNAIESNIEVHNIGWLGNINSPGFSYANPGMKQSWRNGFGILVIDGKNEYFHQIICDNNSFYFNGKSY